MLSLRDINDLQEWIVAFNKAAALFSAPPGTSSSNWIRVSYIHVHVRITISKYNRYMYIHVHVRITISIYNRYMSVHEQYSIKYSLE